MSEGREELFLPELLTQENWPATRERLDSEPDFAAALQQDAVFEAACCGCGHGAPVVGGMTQAADWWHVLAQAHECASDKRDADPLLTDPEWEQVCAAAIDAAGARTARPVSLQNGRQFRLISGKPRRAALAAAAALLLMIGGALMVMRLTSVNPPAERLARATVQPSHARHASGAPLPVATPADTVISRLHVSPVERYGRIGSGRGAIPLPAPRQGVIPLAGRSAILAEAGAKLVVRAEADSVAAIELFRGSALFVVEPKRYRSFTVLTPHVQVRVTGTIFRVSVDSLRTEVAVLEGSVDILRHGDRERLLSLAEGHCAEAQPDTVVMRMIRDSRTLAGRGRLLEQILAADYVQPGICLDDTLIAAGLDSFERRSLDSLEHLTDSAAISRNLLFSIARTLEQRGQAPEAVRLYESLYNGKAGEPLADLALIRAGRVRLQGMADLQGAARHFTMASQLLPRGALQDISLASLILVQLRLGNDTLAVPLMRQYLTAYPDSPPAEAVAFQCGQILRQRRHDWAGAAELYAFVAERFPQGGRRADALYWAGWCRGQQSAQNLGEKAAEKFPRVYPEKPGRDDSPR
jgi:ferric-dicitrate binding protein FerR (iron transport regulator)